MPGGYHGEGGKIGGGRPLRRTKVKLADWGRELLSDVL